MSYKKRNWKHNSRKRDEDYAVPPTRSAKCRNCYKARLTRISQVEKIEKSRSLVVYRVK